MFCVHNQLILLCGNCWASRGNRFCCLFRLVSFVGLVWASLLMSKVYCLCSLSYGCSSPLIIASTQRRINSWDVITVYFAAIVSSVAHFSLGIVSVLDSISIFESSINLFPQVVMPSIL